MFLPSCLPGPCESGLHHQDSHALWLPPVFWPVENTYRRSERKDSEVRVFMALAPSLKHCLWLAVTPSHLFQTANPLTAPRLTLSNFPQPFPFPFPQPFWPGNGNNNSVATSYRLLHYSLQFPCFNFVNKFSLKYPFCDCVSSFLLELWLILP